MKAMEYVSPNETQATKRVIKLFSADKYGKTEQDNDRYFATMDDFPQDKFWIFELIEGFQFNAKVKGKVQTWKIDSDLSKETMFFRCIVSGKTVASRLVEWVTFPIKYLELYVTDGVISLTK